MTWTSSNSAPPASASAFDAVRVLLRAAGAFVRDHIPAHYLAIDEAFVALTPAAAEDAFCDALRRNPRTAEALRARYLAPRTTLDELGFAPRPVSATVADTIAWFEEAGTLSERRAARLGRASATWWSRA